MILLKKVTANNLDQAVTPRSSFCQGHRPKPVLQKSADQQKGSEVINDGGGCVFAGIKYFSTLTARSNDRLRTEISDAEFADKSPEKNENQKKHQQNGNEGHRYPPLDRSESLR